MLRSTILHPRFKRLCLVGGLYFGGALALDKFVLGENGWQIFWPLNGISIALLLMQPRRQWWSFLVAAIVPSQLADYLTATPGPVVVVEGLSNVAEILLGARLLPAFTDLETWLQAPRLYPRFAMAALLGPLLSSAINTVIVVLVQGQAFLPTFLDFTPSEIIGVAAMIPLVLSMRSVPAAALRDVKWWALLVAASGATLIVVLLMFASDRVPLLFLLYPFLMWIEAVLGLLGSSMALACACVFAALLTQEGYGPFANAFASGSARNLTVELYLAFHLISFLPVSIMATERRRLTRELHAALRNATNLAAIDALTGISNRRTFESHFREQWQLAARNRTSLGLLMIDIDHFKSFNDTLGHQAGDECLRAVAQVMKSLATRPSDLVARFGGEEFVVLLPNTPLEGARGIAERVRAAVSELAIEHPGTRADELAHAKRVTVSVGCTAIVPSPEGRMQELIARADQALYSAKHQGRNAVCVYGAEDISNTARPALNSLRDRVKNLVSRAAPTNHRAEQPIASARASWLAPGNEPPSHCPDE
jgi:diguanylate cyclase (GGDEF)-like protein